MCRVLARCQKVLDSFSGCLRRGYGGCFVGFDFGGLCGGVDGCGGGRWRAIANSCAVWFAAEQHACAVGVGGEQVCFVFGYGDGGGAVCAACARAVANVVACGGVGVYGFVFGGEAVVAGACAIYEACDVSGDAGDAGVHVLQERFGADGARCGINAARVCHWLGNGGGNWFV